MTCQMLQHEGSPLREQPYLLYGTPCMVRIEGEVATIDYHDDQPPTRLHTRSFMRFVCADHAKRISRTHYIKQKFLKQKFLKGPHIGASAP